MKNLALTASLMIVGLACSTSSADFRCRGRHISAPCFTTPCHEVVHAATVVTPTVTTIVQEPLPVFVFQNLQGFPSLPASATQFNAPQVAANPSAQSQGGLVLSDAQMDRIALMVAQKLSGAAITQNTLLIPPKIEDEPVADIKVNQLTINDIGSKCASCHMAGTSVKGGLAIFDANRNLNPTKNGQPYATPERLWQRAEAGEMPPNSGTDLSKRLNPESIAFLKTATSP